MDAILEFGDGRVLPQVCLGAGVGAMIQMNLANALAALGERESETARLAEATYDGALAIFVAARTDYYESICRKSRDRVRAILDQRKN